MSKRVWFEEGEEVRDGQIVEESGWYEINFGQLTGPFETKE